MAILYKPFTPLRTALYTLFIGFFLVAGPVLAQTGPYVVEGVTVDISADSAMNARNQAFEKAQQDAVKALAAQFLNESQLAVFQPPPASVISPMVQDFEVTKEKLSTKRYIGTYTFRFKPNAVRQYFGNAAAQIAMPAGPAAPNTIAQAPIQNPDGTYTTPAPATNTSFLRNLLILPFYQTGAQAVLWSPSNGWMQAWQRASLPSNQVVPIGDLTDVSDIGDDEALTYDRARLEDIMTRYSALDAVVLIAQPDTSIGQVPNDATPVTGTLKVTIYRTDRVDGPDQVGRISVAAFNGETRSALYDRAVRQVQQTLLTEWKNTPYVTAAVPGPQVYAVPRNTIEMRVPFANLQEWANAQRTLNGISGVNDIILKSLTPREARVGVIYEGDADTLRVALQQAGMDLSQMNGGIYDLYLKPQAVQNYVPANSSYRPIQQQLNDPAVPLSGLGAQPDVLPPGQPYTPPPVEEKPYVNSF
jgi:hypothetical protein